MGQGDVDDLGSGSRQLLDGGFNGGAYTWGDAIDEVFARQSDFESFDAAVQGIEVVGDGCVETGAVERVMAGHGLQEEGGIAHRFGHRSDALQRRGKGHQPVA